MNKFVFSVDWFDGHKSTWSSLLDQLKPKRLLEIGSFEGRSACYLIEKAGSFGPIELHCIDTWDGGIGQKDQGIDYSNMSAVEERFNNNIKLAIELSSNNIELHIHKGFSDLMLSNLLAKGYSGYFDFIYVDGSHQAPDVLIDAVLSFKLLRSGGLMIFDDYLWKENFGAGTDLLRCPKPAVDAFTNLFARKLEVLKCPLYQFFVQKIND